MMEPQEAALRLEHEQVVRGESDPDDAFWTRVGEGCDAAALATVRKACAARSTQAGGDCKLDLFNTLIGDSGAAALGRALEGLPRPLPYTEILLSRNELGPAGVRSVARGLRLGYGGGSGGGGVGRGLQALWLTDNRYGGDAEAVRTLAEALPPTLKTLSLFNTGLGDPGLGALLPHLGALPGLEVLYLNANELGAGGFGALAAALPSLGALRELGLQGNRGAGSAGVRALAAALHGLHTHVQTHAGGCGADAAAVAELEELRLTRIMDDPLTRIKDDADPFHRHRLHLLGTFIHSQSWAQIWAECEVDTSSAEGVIACFEDSRDGHGSMIGEPVEFSVEERSFLAGLVRRLAPPAFAEELLSHANRSLLNRLCGISSTGKMTAERKEQLAEGAARIGWLAKGAARTGPGKNRRTTAATHGARA